MKTAVVLTSLLAALAISAQATTIESIAVSGATNENGSSVTVTAVITGFTGSAMVMFDVRSTNGLIGQQFQPDTITAVAGSNTWTNTSWNPYFNGAFTVNVRVVTTTDAGDVSATAVTVARTIGGTMNSVQVPVDVSATAYDANMIFTNIDTSKVYLHNIGNKSSAPGVVGIPCNLMNVTNLTQAQAVSEELRDIAFMDTGAYRPAGTPFRIDMTMHARPTGVMGFGDIKRFVWTPDVATNQAGSGNLIVDVVSSQPWRSAYTTNFSAHVGFGALIITDTNMAAEMSGMILCTSAHYLDVQPDNSEISIGNQTGIGLKVNGRSNTTSYLKMFIPDAKLSTFGITNADMATNLLAGYVTHFTSNNVSEGDTTAVTTEFTRIAGGTNIVYAYNSGTNGDSGYEALLTFTFHSPVGAQIGHTLATFVTGDFDKDGKADPAVVTPDGVWKMWWSSADYAPVSTIPLYVAGGVPVAGDFDNDGKADPTMVAPDGVWKIWMSSGDYAPVTTIPLYVAGGVPVAGDFDNDGKADPTMVAPDGVWKIWMSSGDYAPVSTIPLYVAGGVPVAGDFDNDGKADPCMVDASGVWKIWMSSGDYAPVSTIPLYVVGGTPVAGDFDNDGKADPAMVASDGVWTIWMSSADYAPVTTIPLIP